VLCCALIYKGRIKKTAFGFVAQKVCRVERGKVFAHCGYSGAEGIVRAGRRALGCAGPCVFMVDAWRALWEDGDG